MNSITVSFGGYWSVVASINRAEDLCELWLALEFEKVVIEASRHFHTRSLFIGSDIHVEGLSEVGFHIL